MNFREAKKILPKKEFEAFETVIKQQAHRTSPARLKELVRLSRRLRDKYQDMAKKQGQDIRGRGTYVIDTDILDRRVKIFEDIMDSIDELLQARASN